MNIAAEAKPSESLIVAIVRATPEVVLKDPAKFDQLMVAMKAEIAEFVPDVSTKTGRESIASFAYKFARTKKAIDDAGKKLNEDDQKAIKARNEVRNRIVDTLQDLQTEVRKPLTEWETEEDKRIEFVNGEISDLRGAPNFPRTWGPDDLLEAIQSLKARTFDSAKFQDQTDTAIALRDAAVVAMEAAHARLVKEEEDRAELERLRIERAERDKADAEKAAKEQKDRRLKEAQQARAAEMLDYIKSVRLGFIGDKPYPFGILLHELEVKIDPSEFAEEFRPAIEAARVEAHAHLTKSMEGSAERARQEEVRNEENRIAEAARQAEEAIHAKFRLKHEEEIARLQEEQDRRDREEKAKADEAKRIADEDAERAADKKHRTKIMTLAALGVKTFGKVDDDTAKAIVTAIVAGHIPHISIRF